MWLNPGGRPSLDLIVHAPTHVGNHRIARRTNESLADAILKLGVNDSPGQIGKEATELERVKTSPSMPAYFLPVPTCSRG